MNFSHGSYEVRFFPLSPGVFFPQETRHQRASTDLGISTTNPLSTTPVRPLVSRLAVPLPLPLTPRVPRSVPVTRSVMPISPSRPALNSTSPLTMLMPPLVMTRTCKRSPKRCNTPGQRNYRDDDDERNRKLMSGVFAGILTIRTSPR